MKRLIFSLQQTWPLTPSQDGTRFHQTDLFQYLANETPRPPSGVSVDTVLPLALKAREQLFATLAELDDTFANEYLLHDNPERLLPSNVVHECVKRVSIEYLFFNL